MRRFYLGKWLVVILIVLISASVVLGQNGASQKKNGNNDHKTPKIWVGKIEFEGNENISGDALRQTMFTKKSHWWNKHKFMPAVFQDDLSSIIAYYNNRGYLDAEIRAWDSTYVEKQTINLKIVISEGAEYHVGQLTFRGNTVFPAQRLRVHTEIHASDPFSFLKLSQSNWNLVNMYANAGYLDAAVEPRITTNHTTMDITFDIQEGKPVYADTIIIQGLQKTEPRVVKRELKIEQGELLTHSRIVTSQQNLYKTGLFSSVYLNPGQNDTTKAQYRPVVVKLVEAEAGELNAGVGYGSAEQFRISLEALQGNFLGTGQKVGLRGRMNFQIWSPKFGDARIEALYTAPYFIVGGFRLDNSTYLEHDLEPNYTVNRVGTELTVGRDIFQHSRIFTTTKIENNYLAKVDTTSVLDTLNSRIRSISLNYTRDTRNNLFNPTEGSYVKLSGLVAGAIFQGTDEFVKTTADWMRYMPYRSWITYATNLSLGALFEFGQTSSIPIYERLYAGGDQTIRGYRKRGVGPMRGGQPVGGHYQFIFRNEARFNVYKNFNTALFFDMGYVWNRLSLDTFKKIKAGMGFGFRYSTPVGVARLDFALKVPYHSNQQIGRIHLTLGQAF